MYVDVWNVIAKQERELNSVQKLWKLKLITPSLDLVFLMAYYKVSNTVLKTLLKTEVRIKALLRKTERASVKVSAPSRVNPPRPTHPSYHLWLLLHHVVA